MSEPDDIVDCGHCPRIQYIQVQDGCPVHGGADPNPADAWDEAGEPRFAAMKDIPW